MTTISVHRPELLRLPCDIFRNHRKFSRISASWTMTMDSKSSDTTKKEQLSIQLPAPSFHQTAESLKSSDLKFDRLQPSDQELVERDRFEFGKFVAREAVLDEEYWTAAWLRAESHWENRTNERYVDNFKRKFAEQEFNAIKRRCRGLNAQKCSCIVTVKKNDRNVKCTVLKSVVGTLDLSIRYLLHGETIPGELLKAPPIFSCINRKGPMRYGYIANLCVAKSARRQGIASNMLHFTIQLTKSNDLDQLYVHVHRNNRPARELYEKMGFEVILLLLVSLNKLPLITRKDDKASTILSDGWNGKLSILRAD